MKTSVALAALAFLAGCSGYFGDSNPVGGEIAAAREAQRIAHSRERVFTLQHGLTAAYSRTTPVGWSNNQPCRFGTFQSRGLLGYVEYNVRNIPADFFRFNDEGTVSDSDYFHGIDSVSLVLHFFRNAPTASAHTINGTIFFYAASVSVTTTNSFDTVGAALYSLPISFPDTMDSLPVSITLTDTTQELFNYIREAVLGTPNSALVGLALGFTPASGEELLSLSNNDLPNLTLYGKVVRPDTFFVGGVAIPYDTIAIDSVAAIPTIMQYAAFIEGSDTAYYNSHPVLSTVYHQFNDNDTLLSNDNINGLYYAVFKVDKDSILKGLNPDSINMLSGDAVFYPEPVASLAGDTLFNQSTFTEYPNAPQAIDMILRCYLRDSDTTSLSMPSLFSTVDTVYPGFLTPGQTDSVVYPIDKFLAALTDPHYAAVKTLEFGVWSNSITTLARVVFQKKVTIRFNYSER